MEKKNDDIDNYYMLVNIVVSINDLQNESQELSSLEKEYATTLKENFLGNRLLDDVLNQIHNIILNYNTEIAYEQKAYRALSDYLRNNDCDCLDEKTLIFIDSLLAALEDLCIDRTINSSMLFERINQAIEYHLLTKKSLSNIEYIPPINEENIIAFYTVIQGLPKIFKEDKLGTLPNLLYKIIEPMEKIKKEKNVLLQQLFKYQILLSNIPVENAHLLKNIESYLYHILEIVDKDYQIYEAMYEYIINLENAAIIPFLHSEKYATFVAYTELLAKSYLARYQEYTEYLSSINEALTTAQFTQELYHTPDSDPLISFEEYQKMLTYLK